MIKRELIDKFVAEGKTSREIAEILNTSIYAIRYYRQPSKHRIQEHRRKIKRKAIDYCGGKCRKCSYNRCLSAMVFHHLDPSKKDFNLNGNSIGWKKSKKEIDKTILLCKNCHAELHSDQWELTDELVEKQNKARETYVDKPLLYYKEEK